MMIVIEQLVVSNSIVFNQELQELHWGSTDWNKEAKFIKSLLSQPIQCGPREKIIFALSLIGLGTSLYEHHIGPCR